MRRTLIVGGLFLSTMLLNAQSSKAGQDVNLEARNDSSSTLEGSSALPTSTKARYTPDGRRISTGVKEAKLIKQAETGLSASDFHTSDLSTQKMIVRFVVDESGTPKNIEVVKPINPEVDSRVLAAVRQYRYRPATLDGQVIASDLELNLNFEIR
jgi:TonB family protein